jgi:hypothetical protein
MANLFLLISFLYFVVSFLLNSPDNMRMAYLVMNLWLIAKIFNTKEEHEEEIEDITGENAPSFMPGPR